MNRPERPSLRIVVASNADATGFIYNDPFAAISFVGSADRRTPPRFRSNCLLRRIIVRADDCYKTGSGFVALSVPEARRVAVFVDGAVRDVRLLLISCYFGHGRSAAAAVAVSAALGLDYTRWTKSPYSPNGLIVGLLSTELRKLGYSNADPDLDVDPWFERRTSRFDE